MALTAHLQAQLRLTSSALGISRDRGDLYAGVQLINRHTPHPQQEGDMVTRNTREGGQRDGSSVAAPARSWTVEFFLFLLPHGQLGEI